MCSGSTVATISAEKGLPLLTLGTSGISCWRNSRSSLCSNSIRVSSAGPFGRGRASEGARLLPTDPASICGSKWLVRTGSFSHWWRTQRRAALAPLSVASSNNPLILLASVGRSSVCSRVSGTSLLYS
ncbi:hypothetical protein Salat_2563900 [Sesamum alatum]|uniref:Uncharacterized protein n=1 Tax=Sesamum alatum TaxID=300844 RepID=A0AAE1XSR3_9LAMI|nr:hypothetical protein Salat_2563900 [Sesamum alatum]